MASHFSVVNEAVDHLHSYRSITRMRDLSFATTGCGGKYSFAALSLPTGYLCCWRRRSGKSKRVRQFRTLIALDQPGHNGKQ
jgi:hypothetical protein